jgi:hypothetical protein
VQVLDRLKERRIPGRHGVEVGAVGRTPTRLWVLAGVVYGFMALECCPGDLKLGRGRMPAHGAGVGQLRPIFHDSFVAGKAHHHVVMVVESGVELGARRRSSSLYRVWAIVIAPGLFHAVRMGVGLAAVAS